MQINKKQLKLLELFYKGAEKRMVKELEGGTSYNRKERLAIRSDISRQTKTLRNKTRKWTKRNITRNYKAGARSAYAMIGSTGKDRPLPIKLKFGRIDEEAIKAITDDSFLSYDNAFKGTGISADKILNTAQKERIRAIIAEGKITGATRREISNEISGQLNNGFSVVKDRSGRNWNLSRYAETIARTKLIEASNQGTMNQLVSNGYDLVQCSMHFGACPLCTPWEGKVLSITGKTKRVNGIRVQTVETATKAGLFHPNCRHRLVPFHPKFAAQSYMWSTRNQEYLQGLFAEHRVNFLKFINWLRHANDGFAGIPNPSGKSVGDLAREAQEMSSSAVKRLLPRFEDAFNAKNYVKAKGIIRKWKAMGTKEASQYVQTHKNILKWAGVDVSDI